MGLLNRLLRKERPAGRVDEGRDAEPPTKQTINREDLGPMSAGGSTVGASEARAKPAAAETSPSAAADAALRDALNAVQAVAEKARSYVAEIGQGQARANAARKREAASAQPPATQATGALMTEASAAVLIEYLKHFFDLVSMQNRLLERRLDSLEQLISRLDKHVTEDAAEVSARLTTLEGVQLPLVKTPEETRRETPPAREPSPTETTGEDGPTTEQPARAVPSDQPVQVVLRLRGLPSFRSLFAIRDELRRREDVLGAEAASFEAGAAELRVKAAHVIDNDEICGALREATGLEFVARGPMSFEAVAEERRTA